MTISAKVIADSVSDNAVRLTTFQLHFPRIILAEVNTHGALAKNARSTRAVPTSKLIEEVRTNPYVPIKWGGNNPGMQSNEEITDPAIIAELRHNWLKAARQAADQAETLFKLGLHKQWAGRLLEPFMWVDSVVSATDWANFFTLRNHKDAQPEFEALAKAMNQAIDESTPSIIKPGEWHLPYINTYDDVFATTGYLAEKGIPHPTIEEVTDILRKLSAARCARVSYAPFDGDGSIEKELKRYSLLVESQPVHASPTEHQATPDDWVRVVNAGKHEVCWKNQNEWGRYFGWRQFRKQIPGNTVFDR